MASPGSCRDRDAPSSPGSSRGAGAPSSGASSSRRAPPSSAGPVDTDELHRLVDKAIAAAAAGRHALSASYYGRAAALATQLHGNTLMDAHLKVLQASKLYLQAGMDGASDGEVAAYEVVSSVLPLLLRRIEANTLLPGRCTKEEVEYYRRYNDALDTVFQRPAISAHEVIRLGFAVGLATVLEAARSALKFLNGRVPPPAAKRPAAEAFVSKAIDLILPALRSLGTIYSDEEMRFTGYLSALLDHPLMQADTFMSTLRAKWNARAMVAMRVQRGLEVTQMNNEIDAGVARAAARRAADIAEHGLKTCALPLCDKREATMMQYKSCSACRSVWYCSEEHGALHWKEHKPTCRATVAAKRTATEGGAAA